MPILRWLKVMAVLAGATWWLYCANAMTIVIPRGGPVPPFFDQFNKR